MDRAVAPVAAGDVSRGALERLGSGLLRALVVLGLTPATWPGGDWGTVLLEVPGRRTGRLRSTLVTWVTHDGGRYLVSMPGPDPGWVRNVRAAGGQVVLRHGRQRIPVHLEDVPRDGRAAVLQGWYERTGRSPVPRRFFALDRHAPIDRFENVAGEHPVFRIRSRATRVTRDVEPSAMEGLLAHPPRATVAFTDGDRVEVVAARVASRDGERCFGVRPDAAPALDGREVVLLVDGGDYWFELHGTSIRGAAHAASAPPDAALRWYTITPGRVLAWDYATIREEPVP